MYKCDQIRHSCLYINTNSCRITVKKEEKEATCDEANQ